MKQNTVAEAQVELKLIKHMIFREPEYSSVRSQVREGAGHQI